MAEFPLSNLFRKSDHQTIDRQTADIQDNQAPLSTDSFLNIYGVHNNSMDASISEIEVASSDDFLPPDSLIAAGGDRDIERKEIEHRLRLRNIILYALITPMAVIPIWLMVLLSVPVFNKESAVSERMQIAYLAAVASDFVGLYYIITRDLFPDGKTNRKKRKG